MHIRNRRRSLRRPAGWIGRYLVEDRLQEGWYECRVVDLSIGGAALELFGPAPALDSGLRVEIKSTGGTAIGLQLRGRMRNMSPSDGSGVRVGIEWQELSRLEHDVLALLIEPQPVAAS